MRSLTIFCSVVLTTLALSISPVALAKKGGNGGGNGGGDLEALEARVANLEARLANVDADGDGYTPAQGDCDDTLDFINPRNIEKPTAGNLDDGIDNDCDGTIDNARIDGDGDGFVDENDGGLDCDDGDASVFPNNTGWYTDNKDHDCDDGVELRWITTNNLGFTVSNCIMYAGTWSGDLIPACGITDYAGSTDIEFFPNITTTPNCYTTAIDLGYAVQRTQECR